MPYLLEAKSWRKGEYAGLIRGMCVLVPYDPGAIEGLPPGAIQAQDFNVSSTNDLPCVAYNDPHSVT